MHNCIICGKNIPERRLKEGKKTCCKNCQLKTPEARQRRKAALKKTYENPELRQKVSERTKEGLSKLEIKEKLSAIRKTQWEDVNFREKICISIKRSLNTKETKQKLSKAAKEHWQSQDFRQKHSNSMKLALSNIEVRQKLSKSVKESFEKHHNEIFQKKHNSMKVNGSYAKSSWEEQTYELLLTKFDKNDIERQYFDKERYPYNCDFYIKSLDLFIECHYGWHHNEHPFDLTNQSDLDELAFLQEKAQDSRNYKNKIYQWTDLDVRKAQIAKEHSLNWVAFYSLDELKNNIIINKGE